MLYSEKEKWAFVHVPKNAGTAVEYPFTKFSNDDFINARKKKSVKILNKSAPTHHNKWSYWSQFEELKHLTPIAILRNPWDRALSMYTYNLKNSAKNLSEEWGKEDHARLIKEGFKRSWMSGGFFVDGHGKEFEYNKETGRAWGQDDDQYSWLDGKGKWFKLEDGWDEFCSFTKLSVPKKINTTDRGNYRKYYDDQLAERIGTLFARDVELGGYKF